MAYDADTWGSLFSATIGNETRPTDAIDNTLAFATDKFPQFISSDPVKYTLQNAFLKQLFSNDQKIKEITDNIKNGYLPLTGGTMTGALTLCGQPTADMQAATKKYVDGLTTTMTGATVNADGAAGWAPKPTKGQQNNVLTGDGKWSSKSKVLAPLGNAAPTFTALVDWDKLNTLYSTNSTGYKIVKDIVNPNTGITAYGGDSGIDILPLKQAFNTFDALLIASTGDAGLAIEYHLIPMWLFLLRFNTGGLFYLFNNVDIYADRVSVDSYTTYVPGSTPSLSSSDTNNMNGLNFWSCFGANAPIATATPSTYVALSMQGYIPFAGAQVKCSQNSGLIEIYGVTY